MKDCNFNEISVDNPITLTPIWNFPPHCLHFLVIMTFSTFSLAKPNKSPILRFSRRSKLFLRLPISLLFRRIVNGSQRSITPLDHCFMWVS